MTTATITPTHPAEQRVIREGAYEVSRETGDPAVLYFLDTRHQRAEFLRFKSQGGGFFTVCNEKYLGKSEEPAHTYRLTHVMCDCECGKRGGTCYHRRTLRMAQILADRNRRIKRAAEVSWANALLAAGRRINQTAAIP